jgi:hypothetical protein
LAGETQGKSASNSFAVLSVIVIADFEPAGLLCSEVSNTLYLKATADKGFTDCTHGAEAAP